jgi:uncharacterized protein (TIGR00730 family)
MTVPTPPAGLSVCVFCGSRNGERASYVQAAQAVGQAIGARGWKLVYGGGSGGLMGTVANAALAAGGYVMGVIPHSLMEREYGHRGLQELHVVQTMHERKRMMAERADVFLALPGGIGTFEELFEVWTWRQLGYHDKPIGLLDVEAYYAPLATFLASCRDQGFMTPAVHDLLAVGTEPDALLNRLEQLARTATAPDDYLRI